MVCLHKARSDISIGMITWQTVSCTVIMISHKRGKEMTGRREKKVVTHAPPPSTHTHSHMRVRTKQTNKQMNVQTDK